MTLQEARTEFIRLDNLVVIFPANKAMQRAREQAYKQWLLAVRYWRLNHG